MARTRSRSKSKPARRAAQSKHEPTRPPEGSSGTRRPPQSRWAAQAARRRRIARFVVIGVVVVLAAVAIGAYATRYRDPAAPAAPLPGYHITYEVADLQSNTPPSRRELNVRRPFSLRDETFDQDGKRESATISTADHVYLQQNDKLLDAGQSAPSLSNGDFQFSVALPILRDHGLAERRGTETIAGRACTVYRISGALGQDYKKPTDADHADVCVDRDGLVLKELWTIGGKDVRRTTATAVDTTIPDSAVFSIGDQQPEKLPAAAISQLAASIPLDKPPVDGSAYWQADHPPWGFKHTARVRTTNIQSNGQSPTPIPGAVVDVFTKGSAAIVMSQLADSAAPPDGAATKKVYVSGLGDGGVSSVTAAGPQLVFKTDGTAIELKGNVDMKHLIAFAHHIKKHGG
jgi:hypothetical protein